MFTSKGMARQILHAEGLCRFDTRGSQIFPKPRRHKQISNALKDENSIPRTYSFVVTCEPHWYLVLSARRVLTITHLCWVKRDQLDGTCFIITLFSVQHVSDVNTSILMSLRLIRWVTSWAVSGSICVGVTLQSGYGGVVSVCRLKPAYGYHTTIATLQRNTNTHRTRYNPWSNSTN